MTRTSRALAIVGAKLTRGIAPHWHRSDTSAGRCLYVDCGRPAVEHWQLVDEWRLPRRERWAAIGRRVVIRLRSGRSS